MVYGSDANTFSALLVSLISLARHLERPASCTVHLLVPSRDLEGAQRILECFAWGAPGAPRVLLHAMKPLPLDTAGFSTDTGTMNEVAYAKLSLHLHETLLQVPRVIWLDTDTVVQADIGRLFYIRMEHALAAAIDFPTKTMASLKGHLPSHLEHLVQDWQARTFNSGVMVLDLERWRSGNFTSRLLSLAQEMKGYDGDQAPLNLLFQGAWDQVDGRWNVMVSHPPHGMWLLCLHEEAWVLHLLGLLKYYSKEWHPAMSHYQSEPFLEPYLPKQHCPEWASHWRVHSVPSWVWQWM